MVATKAVPAMAILPKAKSDYLPCEAEPAFGDDRPVHGHNSLDKGRLSSHFRNHYFQNHGMTRVDRNEESHVVDGSQNQELTLFDARASSLAEKDRSALADRFDNERPWHNRIIGEMAQELNLIAGNVLDGFDSLAGFDLQHPVHHY